MAILTQLEDVYYFDKSLKTWQILSNQFLFPQTSDYGSASIQGDTYVFKQKNIAIFLKPLVSLVNKGHNYECSLMAPRRTVAQSLDVWVVITGNR